MNKNEILALNAGSKLQLANGDIVTVQSVTPEGMVAFDYDMKPTALAGETHDLLMALPIAMRISDVQPEPPIQGGLAEAPAGQASVSGGAEPPPTKVVCQWIELTGATRLT